MWSAEIKILNMSYRGIEELITQVVDDDNIVDTGFHGSYNLLTKPSGVETWKPEEIVLQKIRKIKREYLETKEVREILNLMDGIGIGDDRMKTFMKFLLTTFNFGKSRSFSQVCRWLSENPDFPNPLTLTYFTQYTEWKEFTVANLYHLRKGSVVRVTNPDPELNDDIFVITRSAKNKDDIVNIRVWNKDSKHWNIKIKSQILYELNIDPPVLKIKGKDVKTFQYLQFTSKTSGWGPLFIREPFISAPIEAEFIKYRAELEHLTNLLERHSTP